MSIAVAVMPDPGAPQVGITLSDLSSPAVISVQVSWKAGEWHSVIGAKEVEVFGSAFFRDHICPLNVEATYRVVVHSGTMTGDEQAWITVSSNWTWLQDPRDPRAAVQVTCERDDDGRTLMVPSFAAAQYRQQVDMAQPLGARQPVASIGQRLMAGEVPLTVSYEVAAEGGELQHLLMNAGQIVIRGHHHGLLDDVAHVVIGDAEEERRADYPNMHAFISTWNLSATTVRPGSVKVVLAWFTYAAVAELWPEMTYAQVSSARPGATYLDWQADPTPP